MIPFTNEEITALLCDAMPAARNLAESKAAEHAANVEINKAATLAAFPDATLTTVYNEHPTENAAYLSDAPAGSGE